MRQRRRDDSSSAGFGLVQVIVFMAIASILMYAQSGFLQKLRDNPAMRPATSRLTFYQDLLVAQTNQLLGNLLFWLSNVPEGCQQAGLYLRGLDPRLGGQPNPLIVSDFVTPFASQGFRLELFHDASAGSAAKAAMLGWYATADKATEPAALAITSCLQNPDVLRPGDSLFNRSRFDLCFVVDLAWDPGVRQAIANTATPKPQFALAYVKANLYDVLRGDIPCTGPASIIGNINRGVNFSINTYLVGDLNAKPTALSRLTGQRSFFSEKQPRMLINCSNRQNETDAVFIYLCG